MVSALGYEGPISIGGFFAAISIVVGTVLAAWLVARWLIGRFSGR